LDNIYTVCTWKW